MTPRARRVTMWVAVLGAIIVVVLIVAHWPTVRDHVEAWHFQLRTETITIEPDPALQGVPANITFTWHGESMHTQAFIYIPLSFLEALANYGGKPVILPAEEQYGHFFPVLERLNNRVPVGTAREFLWVFGWRVIEQRFPRQAYVVIADHTLDMDSRARLENVFFTDPESLKQFLRRCKKISERFGLTG